MSLPRAAGHTPYQPRGSCPDGQDLSTWAGQLLMTGQSTNNRLLNRTGRLPFIALLTGIAFHLSHDDIAFTGNRWKSDSRKPPDPDRRRLTKQAVEPLDNPL